MLNQFIRIQTRYVGLIASGCLTDELVGLASSIFAWQCSNRGGKYFLAWTGSYLVIMIGDRAKQPKRPHRLPLWHSLPKPMRLQHS